jgi:ketosteroid isomerase-like protein
MKGILTTVVLLFAVASPLLGQAKPQTAAPAKGTSAEQELTKLTNDWNAAMAKRDVAALERILSDDWISAGFEEGVGTKAQFLADLKSGNYALFSTVVHEMNVRAYGNAAVVITHYTTVKEQYKGKDISGSYRTIDTWVKRAGRWQCVATAGTKITKK